MPYAYDHPMPAVTVDLVLFRAKGHSFSDAQLQALLVKRGNEPEKGKYALPGGFLDVDLDETLEQAAKRELAEETSVTGIELEQFHVFGDKGRDPRGRIVTVAYLGVVPRNTEPRAGDDAKEAVWLEIGKALSLELAFDHRKILAVGFRRLRYFMMSYDTLPEPRPFPLVPDNHYEEWNCVLDAVAASASVVGL